MELRSVGHTGLNVSCIGLGGNTFGQTADTEASLAILRRALELGITFIDTSDSYGNGRSEELIGQAIAGHRDDVVVATKCGWQLAGDPCRGGLSRRWILRAIEDSLRRLGTDYVDLFQAHVPDETTPLEETLRAMDDVVRSGKARYIGCSNYAAWQLAEAHAISERNGLTRWISAQNRWNLLEGLSDPHLLPACRALGVGLIPYTPLAAGVLTGKYRAGQAPPPGTRVADVPYTRRNLTDENLATVERLRPWTEERGHSPADLAIAWLLAHPEVPSVIVGARRVEQLEANVRAAEWRLAADDREAVLALATNAA